MACRDPGSTSCSGTQTACATGVMALSVGVFFCLFFLFVCFGFFEPLEPGDQDSLASLSLWLPHSGTYRAPLPEVFLCYSARAHRGAPQDGVLLCRSVHQALKGAHWVGSCSVVQCIRHSMGQPLYCSAADADVLGGESLW